MPKICFLSLTSIPISPKAEETAEQPGFHCGSRTDREVPSQSSTWLLRNGGVRVRISSRAAPSAVLRGFLGIMGCPRSLHTLPERGQSSGTAAPGSCSSTQQGQAPGCPAGRGHGPGEPGKSAHCYGLLCLLHILLEPPAAPGKLEWH